MQAVRFLILMESWSYSSEGKGLFFSDEMDLPVDAFARGRKPLLGWDLKPSSDFEAVERMEFMDFADMNKKPFYGSNSMGNFGAEFGNDYAKRVLSPAYYHKRHKVCEGHSKSAKVIVNGIEQRFCQQCSRFHLLAEFDDGKRSCRKRLAGHNERRRKLHFNTRSGKSQKLLQSYQGTKFLGTSMPKRTPFLIPNIFQGDLVYPERYEHAYQCQQVKSEEKPIYSPQSAMQMANGQLLPKSFFYVHGNGKQYVPGTFSSATEAFSAPNAASTVTESSGVSRSDCALSLLSAQSQNLSSHATGIQVTRPLINQAGHAHHNSGKSAAVSSLEKANGFYSCGMKPMGVGQAGSVVVSDAGRTVNFEVQADGYFQDSCLLSAKYCLSPENGTTVDMLQLSTNLQRVERQRHSMQVKQENEDRCYFLTT
ncbi:hypothetical protein REPUB_Repub01dG0028100 [Reevesia pubescens]